MYVKLRSGRTEAKVPSHLTLCSLNSLILLYPFGNHFQGRKGRRIEVFYWFCWLLLARDGICFWYDKIIISLMSYNSFLLILSNLQMAEYFNTTILSVTIITFVNYGHCDCCSSTLPRAIAKGQLCICRQIQPVLRWRFKPIPEMLVSSGAWSDLQPCTVQTDSWTLCAD